MMLKDLDRVLRAAHVAPLCDELCPRLNQRLGLVARNLILRRTRKGDVDLAHMRPGPGSLDVLELVLEVARLGNLCQLLALDLEFLDESDVAWRYAGLVHGNERALAVGERHDHRPKFNGLERGVLRNVAGTRDCNPFAFEALFAARRVLNHVLDVLCFLSASIPIDQMGVMTSYIDQAIPGGLWPYQATSP